MRNVFVFPEAVMNPLRLPPGARLVARRPLHSPRLVVALGRVIAHEIVHAIAPSHPHSSQGLMRESLTRSLLLASDLHVDALSADAIRAAIRSDAAPMRHASAPLR